MELVLLHTTAEHIRTAAQMSMLRPLVNIQEICFLKMEETVFPTVKISKTSIKLPEYPVSITISNKQSYLFGNNPNRLQKYLLTNMNFQMSNICPLSVCAYSNVNKEICLEKQSTAKDKIY